MRTIVIWIAVLALLGMAAGCAGPSNLATETAAPTPAVSQATVEPAASPTPVEITPAGSVSGGEATTQTATPTVAVGGQESGLVLTLDNNGQTLTLSKGQRFLLKLGEGYEWQVVIADQSVVARVKNVMVIKGAQGLYEALAPGQTEFSAQGDPLCRTSKPACAQPSLIFRQTIIVQ